MTAEVVEYKAAQNAVAARDPESVADDVAIGLNLDQWAYRKCRHRLTKRELVSGGTLYIH